jgi:predicted solute-binding protein
MKQDGDARLQDGLADMQSQMFGWWCSMMVLPLSMGVEAMRFTSRRLSAQADSLATIAQCRSLSDAASAQSRFAERMVADYRDEAQTVAREVQEAMPSTRVA